MKKQKKIGLIDIDSKIPNYALMKISNYHKKKGDIVEWAYPLNYKSYDKIYASSVFDFSDKSIVPKNAIKGGPGYGKNTLPKEIDGDPDYSIYPESDFSFLKYSKGCFRNCAFCNVHINEGPLVPIKTTKTNKKGKWIYLLDNNFFGSPLWRESIEHLIEKKQPVQFEGVDIRIMNEEKIYYLDRVKIRSKQNIHLAWDNPDELIDKMIHKLIKKSKRYRYMVYVLIGFNTTHEEDLYRIEKLRELQIDPFVMPYNRKNKYQSSLARYVNMKAVFRSCKWKDYRGYVA